MKYNKRSTENDVSLSMKDRVSLNEDASRVKRIQLHASNVGLSADQNKEMIIAPYPDTNTTLAGWYTALPSVATTLNVSSTSTDDDVAGTGARTVKIIGVSSTFELVEETVDLDGTNAVQTNGNYVRLVDFEVATCGSDGQPQGDIRVWHTNRTGHEMFTLSGDATQLADGRASAGYAFVPKDYVGYLSDIRVSTDAQTPVIVSIYKKRFDIDGSLPAGSEYPMLKKVEKVCSDQDSYIGEANVLFEEGSEIFISKYASNDPGSKPVYVTACLNLIHKDFAKTLGFELLS